MENWRLLKGYFIMSNPKALFEVELQTTKNMITGGFDYKVVVFEITITAFGEGRMPIAANNYKTLKRAQANRDMLRKAYNCEVA